MKVACRPLLVCFTSCLASLCVCVCVAKQLPPTCLAVAKVVESREVIIKQSLSSCSSLS